MKYKEKNISGKKNKESKRNGIISDDLTLL